MRDLASAQLSAVFRDGRRFVVVRAPSGLGLRAKGVEGLTDALIEHDVAEALSARVVDAGEPPPAKDEVDPVSGIMNAPEISSYSIRLASAVDAALRRGDFPVVLGGDCSILLGILLALRHRQRAGLLFLDGHADFYQPGADISGEAASMELAAATGYGPSRIGDLDLSPPLVRPEDVAVVGFRDLEEQKRHGSQPLPPQILGLDLEAVRRIGAASAAERALYPLTRSGGPDVFWIHLDADVLADDVMPAVDYRQSGGLSGDEVLAILGAAVDSGRAVGADVTIYNPRLDRDRRAGAALADVLLRGLTTRVL